MLNTGSVANLQPYPAGVLKLTIADFTDSAKRPLDFSMITAMALYPLTLRGLLAALRFSNWQVITSQENSQCGMSGASKSVLA